ncbi:MAG: glycosyltransferase family 2 protein [Lachnospiraceae bacterium]|jgi:Glycosyltransferases involved in cell wall biogenesis
MPRVSVIMPLYNAEKYVKQSINSILNQTYTDFELVIVDDQSTDNSYEIVQQIQDKRIHLFQNSKNLGIAQTRNIALQHASGEYIAIMDDDDIAPLYRFEKEILYLDSHKDIIAVGGHCRYIDKDGNDLGKQWNIFTNPMYINAHIIFDDPIPNSSGMVRNEIIQKYNIQYKDNMYGTEDYRFWAECSVYGFLGNINEVMLYWRTNYENETEKAFKLYSQERKNAIAGTQKYLLEKLGFCLEESDINILVSVFEEHGSVSSIKEIQELFYALQKITKQAKEMKMVNAKEIAIMCRKRFGEKTGKAFFLWE